MVSINATKHYKKIHVGSRHVNQFLQKSGPVF